MKMLATTSKNILAAAALCVPHIGDALAATNEDIKTRFEYRSLCNYKMFVAPMSPGLSACGAYTTDIHAMPAAVNRAPIEVLRAEQKAFWVYWNSRTDDFAKEIVLGYPFYMEQNDVGLLMLNGKLVEVERLTAAEISSLPAAELCYEYAVDSGNRAKAARELSRRKLMRDSDMRSATNGSVNIGMAELAVYCTLGEPDYIHRSVGAWGEHKQLVYGRDRYIYVENGIVTSFQD